MSPFTGNLRLVENLMNASCEADDLRPIVSDETLRMGHFVTQTFDPLTGFLRRACACNPQDGELGCI